MNYIFKIDMFINNIKLYKSNIIKYDFKSKS